MPRILSIELFRPVRCFTSLLEQSIQDDGVWQKLTTGISRHGLLTFMVHFESNDHVSVDVARLWKDRSYRRKMAAKLAQPVAPDYKQVVMPLDRSNLVDPEYLSKMAGILGYRWLQRMGDQDSSPELGMVLRHLTPDILLDCLDRLYRYESHAEGVSKRIMLRFAYEEMDRHPAIVQVFSELNDACDRIEQNYDEQVTARLDAIREDRDRQFAIIQENANRRFDELAARFSNSS